MATRASYAAAMTGRTVWLESMGHANINGDMAYALIAGADVLLTFAIPPGSALNPFFVLERLRNFTDLEAHGSEERLRAKGED